MADDAYHSWRSPVPERKVSISVGADSPMHSVPYSRHSVFSCSHNESEEEKPSCTRSRGDDSLTFMRLSTFTTEEIMRATPLNYVLRHQGDILARSDGSEETYNLSDQAEEIDWFISHNWLTPRRSKFLALAIFFNSRLGLLLAYGFMLVAFVLTALGKLLMFRIDGSRTRGLYCTVGGPVVFLLALVFSADVSAACCPLWRKPRVFLDKICVNQVDAVLKRKAIESLGAFLRNSKGMVIVYTDIYLHRLWTVYEVASVMLLNPAANVEFIPTFYPKIILSYMVAALVIATICQATSFESTARFIGAHSIAVYICTAALCWQLTICGTVLAHGWSKNKAQIYSDCQGFHLGSAKCFCEEDRELVRGNIAASVRELGIIERRATDAAAFFAFDTMVQNELPQLISALFGRAGIRYDYVLVVCIPCLGWALDALGSMIHDGTATASELTFAVFVNLTFAFSFSPNLMFIMMVSGQCGLKLRGAAEVFLIVLKGTCALVAMLVLQIVMDVLPVYSWKQALYMLPHLILTLLVYWPKSFKLRKGAQRIDDSYIGRPASSSDDEAGEDFSNDAPTTPETAKVYIPHTPSDNKEDILELS